MKEADKVLVLEKEKRKLVILRQRRKTWRQKSRLNWLALGDRNTKFLHAFANSRKLNNTIWDITKEDRTVITCNQGLEEEAVGFFQNIFKAQENLTITNQLAVLRHYPRIFSEEEGHKVAEHVTLAEILSTLKGFSALKSPRPNGWIVEFFLAFFDLVGNETLEMVEETRRKGRVNGALNATFLALIPKSNKPESFGGYRPIALCNLVYKIMSKIIATRIKSCLSFGISKEQFRFLEEDK
jgi:hypothetical protein